MATAPSPNDLTRQQLDELDALLQRMLSVPLAPADTPLPAAARAPEPAGEPPLPPSWRVDTPGPAAGASSPHLYLPEPPSAPKLDVPPPLPAPKPAAAPPPKPVAKAAPAPAPAPVPAPKVATVPPPLPRPAPATGLTPVPAAPPVAFPLLPLVALNALFDGACGMFGWPGRVLRSGFFKYLYGLTGLALLAYTGAHVAQQMGWITLPAPFPWPR